MVIKNIRVHEKVHKQVVKIAKANFRGIGDQVAFWAANDCPHPVGMREEKAVTMAFVEDGQVGADHTLRVFYCKQCQKHVLSEPQPELAAKLDQLSS